MNRKEVMPMPDRETAENQPVVDISEQYKPTPRQTLAHCVTETNVLYGG